MSKRGVAVAIAPLAAGLVGTGLFVAVVRVASRTSDPPPEEIIKPPHDLGPTALAKEMQTNPQSGAIKAIVARSFYEQNQSALQCIWKKLIAASRRDTNLYSNEWNQFLNAHTDIANVPYPHLLNADTTSLEDAERIYKKRIGDLKDRIEPPLSSYLPVWLLKPFKRK